MRVEFDVVGYAHRELKFEVFYKARVYGQDQQIGVVVKSMLGIDVSRSQSITQDVNLKDHPEVQKIVTKLGTEQGKQAPSIEFLVNIEVLQLFPGYYDSIRYLLVTQLYL